MVKIRDYILCKEIQEIGAISMIKKTTSTLFRNEKDLFIYLFKRVYDNYLYNS